MIEYYSTQDLGGDPVFESSDPIVPRVGEKVRIVTKPLLDFEPSIWEVVSVEYWLSERGTDVSVNIKLLTPDVENVPGNEV